MVEGQRQTAASAATLSSGPSARACPERVSRTPAVRRSISPACLAPQCWRPRRSGAGVQVLAGRQLATSASCSPPRSHRRRGASVAMAAVAVLPDQALAPFGQWAQPFRLQKRGAFGRHVLAGCGASPSAVQRSAPEARHHVFIASHVDGHHGLTSIHWLSNCYQSSMPRASAGVPVFALRQAGPSPGDRGIASDPPAAQTARPTGLDAALTAGTISCATARSPTGGRPTYPVARLGRNRNPYPRPRPRSR